MAMRIFIDTNIFLSILNKESGYEYSKKVFENIHEGKLLGFTSVLCISEILSGFYAKGKEEEAERTLLDILSIRNLKVVDINVEIAKEGAKIRGKYKIKLPDALILSTCKLYDCSLVTRDESLKKIKEIEVVVPEEVSKEKKIT
jgi:predicted nucleic acid-binding protein